MVAGLNLSWHATEGAGSVCKCMGQCTLEGSVQGGGRDLGVQNFFNWFFKLTNQKRPKVTCSVCH